MIQFALGKYLEKASSFVLEGIGNPDLELILVMVFIPLIMNMIAFWIQDNFLKEDFASQKKPEGESPKMIENKV